METFINHTNMTTELTTIIERSLLPQTQAELLLQNFTEFFENAKTYESQAKSIVVSDENDKVGMRNARELRLKLQKIRTQAENKRKELKEQSLREGKAIDGIANVIKALIVPIEEHLEKQEKFAEIKAEQIKEMRRQKRIVELSPYTDLTLGVGDMPEDVYAEYLSNAKAGYEARKKAEEQAEQERMAKIEADKVERERMQTENAKLKAEAEEREKAQAEERIKAEQEKQKAIDEERAKQEKIRQEEAEKARIAAEEKANEERQRKENVLDSVVELIIACKEDKEAIKDIIRKYIN